ncbi:unnamed protein product [Closterium sp. NIES-53]
MEAEGSAPSGPSGSGGMRGAGEAGRGVAGGSAPIASILTPDKDDEFRRKELTAAAGEGGGSAYGMNGFKGRGSKKGKAKEGSGGEQHSGKKRGNKEGKRCDGKCWYCYVEGHPWFMCCKLLDGWRPGQPGGHGRMFYHVGEACSDDMVVPASKVALQRSSHWVIDTGAFMTMTNREDLLDEVRPSKAATVVSAFGQVVPVRGEGRAMFMGADGRLVGLKRVLLIPGLCTNLLCTKAVSEAGMKMEMMGTKVFKATLDGCVLWDVRGGKDMHQSMWEIPVLPWKEAAARLAAKPVSEGHASHITNGGGGDGSDGGLLVHGGGCATKLTWSFPLAKKSDAARVIIEEWLPMVERESGKRVKAIRSDRGGQFLGAEFQSWLKRNGIKQQLTTAYTPHSNGVAERANRTIIEGQRMILVDSGLPLRFWPPAICHATVIKNRVLTHVGGQHWVPMKKWSGKKPLVDMLCVFGCMGLVHVPKEKRDKLQVAVVWAVHLGLARGSKGWLMRDPKSNTIFTTRDAKFMEGLMFKEWSERGRSKVTIPLGIEVGTNDPLLIPMEFSSSSELTEVSHDLGGAEGEAADVEEVMQRRKMRRRMEQRGRWSPFVAGKVEQMDVKMVFLYGMVDEIYMKQPEGYDDGSGRVCRLKKAIYGLKQAPRCWYARLVEVLEALGFKVSGCDESLFMTEGEEEKVFLLVYVDGILFFSPSLERIKEVQGKLKETVRCKAFGPVGYYLGLHVERDEVKEWLRLHQHKYLAAMGEKYGLEKGRSVKTPLPSGFQVHLDEKKGGGVGVRVAASVPVNGGELDVRIGQHSPRHCVFSFTARLCGV